jgi:hypothetical protein
MKKILKDFERSKQALQAISGRDSEMKTGLATAGKQLFTFLEIHG